MLEQLPTSVLFASLPTPTMLIDAHGGVLAANEEANNLFEYDSLAGLNITALLGQPERSRLNPLAWLKKWAERPDAPELDYVFMTCTAQSGASKHLSTRVRRIDLPVPESVGYLVSMHDMTALHSRYRHEQDAHRLSARLLSITADGVIITDEEQLLTYVNESAERMFSYAAGELLGKPLATLIPARLHRAHADHVTQFRTSKQPSRLMAGRQSVTGLTKNGQEIPVDVSITRINQKGRAVFSALIRSSQDG